MCTGSSKRMPELASCRWLPRRTYSSTSPHELWKDVNESVFTLDETFASLQPQVRRLPHERHLPPTSSSPTAGSR